MCTPTWQVCEPDIKPKICIYVANDKLTIQHVADPAAALITNSNQIDRVVNNTFKNIGNTNTSTFLILLNQYQYFDHSVCNINNTAYHKASSQHQDLPLGLKLLTYINIRHTGIAPL